ncbi:putative cytochrome P450 [Cucurbitaria berberidis CBS 394.84]|uniref:Cytochrome P450 n=1 Tax=Cucurbitaria berberidis CBS 394.84 TaxID=1168544 RepID=A0A9P4LAD0_9PLEO|nr:putative cytochrome P450 [Cucurbitaria berberidis CBS 394.84]KAF1847237.1 putative cytochrome P450 [Cucurbitaria berberidis CBS 394.84]
MMLYSLLILFPISIFISRRMVRLVRNYISARKYGLPIIIIPVSFEDAWWIVLRPLFSFIPRLPFNLGHWYLYTTMGWTTEDGNRSLLKYGENFVLCSPTSNVLVTSEQGIVETVFGSHGKWAKQQDQSRLFAFYGENVSSTHGDVWRRHRKITASAFNESTMWSVWDEATRRAGELSLVDADVEGGNGLTLAMVRSKFDLLAMQILSVVGFGQNTDLTERPTGHQESLMECLGFILQHIILTVVFNSLKAPDFLLPGSLRRLKVSIKKLGLYMKESVLQHVQSAKSKPVHGSKALSLLESMVRANEASKQEQKTGGPRSYLSDSELYGNIFVFNVAGYETTASSFIFALSYLAAHPDMQDWAVEEIDRYYDHDANIIPDYAETYPKLVRCLAIMHETLRLATPAPMLVRYPYVPTEVLVTTKTGARTVTVEPDTLVGFNTTGAHLSPRWGPDALSFNPKRFILPSSSGEEELVVPEGPLYAPFMMGPRVCPGKKFSQVEFVAVLARVLMDWRVEVVRGVGESEEHARLRLMSVVEEKKFNVSAHLKRPEDARVRFVRQGKFGK